MRRICARANGIGSDRCRHNEGLCIVDFEGRKCAGWALDDRFVSFNEIEDVDGAVGVVRDGAGEPVAAGLDEFESMKAGAFFAPARGRVKGLDMVDQVFLNPGGAAIPADIRKAVIEVERAGAAIEAHARPIPELKGKDVRGSADLEHHGVAAGAVDGSRGDEEVVVLACRKFVDVLLGIELGKRRCGCGAEIADHCGGVDGFAQAEIDTSIGRGIEQIVAFILGVIHAEMGTDVSGKRVNLER